MSEVTKRNIPKKYIFVMFILVILGCFVYYIINVTREAKVTQILYDLGYTSIKNVQVVNRTYVENKDTRRRGVSFKLLFFDNNTQKNCIGFVYKNNSKKYEQNIDCTL